MTFKERYLKKPFALGTSEFTEIIDDKSYYCDKTLLVKDLIDSKSKVILFTRPRRFGKTLNMTMLRTFFEKPTDGKDKSHYFKNLKIWQAGGQYTKEQGSRPVIYLTLKDIKPRTFEHAIEKIKETVFEELGRHYEVFESDKLNSFEKKQAENLANNLSAYGILTNSIKTLEAKDIKA